MSTRSSLSVLSSGNLLVRSGFGGWVHAVLGDFVKAAGGRLDLMAIKMVERDSTFADGVTLLDGFGYVGLGESGGLEKRTSCA